MEAARGALQAAFGYGQFRPGQEAAISAVLAGRDTLVVLPTGGGKSLCFQIPALVLPGLTVVVSPLISLMKDQVDALEARKLPASFINSTLTAAQVSDRLARAARGEIKLLYLAPERFDFGNVSTRLGNMEVSLLAIDEAHCISQWGHDFRPSYLRVAEARKRLGSPPTVALTATATPEVREDICRQLALRKPETIITGFDRTNLSYHVLPARNDAEKDSLLVDTLKRSDGLAVIYAATRKSVDRLSFVLEREGISAAGYHAGLDDAHRRDVQEAFMTERIRAIIATNAFGMGIDKPNVRLVIHHAMPGTLEAYYQEAGRAGRDGEHSDVFLLHSFPDRFTHEYFIRSAHPDRQTVELVYDALARQAVAGRPLPATPEDIVPLIKAKVSDREVESALRILQRAGAIADAGGSNACVTVRLLATPDRIKHELPRGANPELGLLRALWRMAGDALSRGTTVDLDFLPPGLAGRATAQPLLESLQSRQFLIWARADDGLSLPNPSMSVADFRIDWVALGKRRAGELAKLDAVQRYAYAKTCRRGFILRYFGDPAARERCTGCDNCLGTTTQRPGAAKQNAKRSAARDGRGFAGGSSRLRSNPSGIASVQEPLDADAGRLFAALKARRSEIARDEKLPAYIVFSDRTLAEMAMRKPRSLSALGEVRGVGGVKLARYGETFLAVIRDAEETEAA